MELGLDFDDCDFAKKPKDKALLTSYNAKYCPPKWFLTDEADDGTNDKATVYKFRGDYFYRLAQYRDATANYQESLDALGSLNRTMRREMTESLARCYVYTGHFSQAYETAVKMTMDCLTVDQMCQALLLQQFIFRNAGCIKQELQVAQQLVEAHPFNFQVWLKLAEVYESIQTWMESHVYTPCIHGSSVCSDAVTNKIDPTVCSKSIKEKNEDPKSFEENKNLKCSGLDMSTNSDIVSNRMVDISSKNMDRFNTSTEISSREKSSTNSSGSSDKGVKSTISAEETGSSALLTEFSPKDCDELLTGYSCQLMQLTCLVRVKLILLSVQDTVGSIIKERNTQVLAKIEEKIQALTSSEEVISKVTEFMKNDMFEDSFCGSDAGDKEDDSGQAKWTTDKCPSVEEFNRKWFSWTTDVPVDMC